MVLVGNISRDVMRQSILFSERTGDHTTAIHVQTNHVQARCFRAEAMWKVYILFIRREKLIKNFHEEHRKERPRILEALRQSRQGNAMHCLIQGMEGPGE